MPTCLRLLAQATSCAFSRALRNDGESIEARMEMMAMTTNISMRVKYARHTVVLLNPQAPFRECDKRKNGKYDNCLQVFFTKVILWSNPVDACPFWH